jgi:hypothetical protein
MASMLEVEEQVFELGDRILVVVCAGEVILMDVGEETLLLLRIKSREELFDN